MSALLVTRRPTSAKARAVLAESWQAFIGIVPVAANPQFGQVIVDSRIKDVSDIEISNRQQGDPSGKTCKGHTTEQGLGAGRLDRTSVRRRRHSNTAPARRQVADTASSNVLWGAASVATPTSQAEPRPTVANRNGRPQQEATPNAAAKPLKVRRGAPV
ncbi:MAG: hypothetical protein KGI47_11915, partial [Betaproteobacteria bacterium]|nr:hypothetical protein [Betaproteobacteria bacterium]